MNNISFDNMESIQYIEIPEKQEPVVSDPEHVIITEKFLEAGYSSKGALTYSQLNLLGIPTPSKSGWRKKLLGTEIPKSIADEFLNLKDLKGSKGRKELRSHLETMVENDEMTTQEKQEIIHLRKGNKKVQSIRELSWNEMKNIKPYNQQLCAFITEIGLPRCGYYDADSGYFNIVDKDGKKYPFKNIEYWYALPLIKKKK